MLLDDGVTQWPEEVWPRHLDYARWIVGSGGHVVELVRADDLDIPKWQRFLDEAARRQLKPIIRLATFQDRARGHWVAPTRDRDGRGYRDQARQYARFISGLRFDQPLPVLVGNEPNRGDEWGGRPSPAEYARFLLDVSNALHQAAPGRVLVLNGGLDQYAPDTAGEEVNNWRSYDAASFLAGMHAAEPRVWEALDAWSAHAYPLGPFAAHPASRGFQIDDLTTGGPRTRTAPWPGLYNRGLNSYQWELYWLRSLGVQKRLPVYVTETGWRHVNAQTRSGDDAGAVLPAEVAAEYLLLAFDGARQLAPHELGWTPWSADPDVVTAVIFALGGEPTRWGHTNLVDLGPNGEILGLKPQFEALVRR